MSGHHQCRISQCLCAHLTHFRPKMIFLSSVRLAFYSFSRTDCLKSRWEMKRVKMIYFDEILWQRNDENTIDDL